MSDEIAAAIIGAAIAALVAVVLFVIERTVARHAAFVERRRLAFDEVIVSLGTYVTAALETGGIPSADNAARLVTSRARMSLALGRDDRALNWWLNGMEKRVGDAARLLATSNEEGIERIEALNSNVTNTLIDIHLGALSKHDLTVPAALFFIEATEGPIPAEFAETERFAERPRRDKSKHTANAYFVRMGARVARPFRRNRRDLWLPRWARTSDE